MRRDSNQLPGVPYTCVDACVKTNHSYHVWGVGWVEGGVVDRLIVEFRWKVKQAVVSFKLKFPKRLGRNLRV